MTTFPLPLFLQMQDSLAISQLRATLLEPFFVIAVGLFWLAALLVGAFMSAAVATYDILTSLNATALRLPHLRGSAATNPLLLCRNRRARRGETSRASRSSQTGRTLEN
jgi:hypothetical protein